LSFAAYDPRDAVLQLLASYGETIDHRDADRWCDLFTIEGVFRFAGREVRGQDRLRIYAAQSPQGIHVIGLPSLEVSSDRVHATAAWIFHNADTGSVLSGYYHDEIVVHDGVARFAVRDVRLAFRPAAPEPAT
jgi:hypothetical protein